MTDSERETGHVLQRPPYRPPVGIPTEDAGDGRKGAAFSLIVHLFLIALLVLSTRTPPLHLNFDEYPEAGTINLPSGGGGGGTRGTGGKLTRQERVEFVQVAPPTPVVIPPKEVIKPPPIVPTPEIKPPEEKKPDPPPPTPPQTIDTAKVVAVATAGTIDTTVTGRGGGSGNDGTAGNGPGRGGGTGGGDGTGDGNGTGPGRGGGGGNIFAPTMVLTPLLPEAPNKLRPYECIAVFDVGANGAILGFNFNRTGDRGYDRSIEAVLKTVRFRPAVDLQGRPIRASAKVTFSSR